MTTATVSPHIQIERLENEIIALYASRTVVRQRPYDASNSKAREDRRRAVVAINVQLDKLHAKVVDLRWATGLHA